MRQQQTIIGSLVALSLALFGHAHEFHQQQQYDTLDLSMDRELATNVTESPTASPTAAPTSSPTISPTSSPTISRTSSPTTSPTSSPTTSPTSSHTTSPTSSPTTSPVPPPPPPPAKICLGGLQQCMGVGLSCCPNLRCTELLGCVPCKRGLNCPEDLDDGLGEDGFGEQDLGGGDDSSSGGDDPTPEKTAADPRNGRRPDGRRPGSGRDRGGSRVLRQSLPETTTNNNNIHEKQRLAMSNLRAAAAKP
eukprot:CAMPEP_0172472794 /NCGR_PEP_ID=MMETSP1065-20121228/68530_1 /TAXON_ID=265537 /ORGANISM="Amphiprora paludosa, Strain CCMP125" /LENGTH=248 /DNA_ID=CAMNT_0013230959 /DNA_START=198 /DNA_END=944 /DNA_ORIENTATION=+